MKKLIPILLLCAIATSVHAQSVWDSVGQYVQQKNDDAQQYIEQKKNESRNQQQTPAQGGQIALPGYINDIVPDTGSILPSQGSAHR